MEIENEIEIQMAKKEMIEGVVANIKKAAIDKRTFEFYKRRIEQITHLYEDFTNRHTNILILKKKQKPAKELEYFEKDIFSVVDEYVDSVLVALREKKKLLDTSINNSNNNNNKNSNNNGSSSNTSQESGIKLPKISLEKFSGDYKKWPTFHDLFKSLVHSNASLGNVQKLQYLKLHLEGEAENLLRHFNITDNNYDPAWTLLVERYDNKRVLVNSHLKPLLTQRQGEETAQGVRSLLDNTTENLQALNNLGIKTENWDPILVYLVVQKLPQETHQLWEQSLSSNKNLPSWKELQIFLEARFRTLEAIAAKKGVPERKFYQQNFRNGQQVLHMATYNQCVLCKNTHHVRKCPQFLNLDYEHRFEIVKSKNLCLNCLTQGHRYEKCNSNARCLNCSKPHHTLLHRESSIRPNYPTVAHMMSSEAQEFRPSNIEMNTPQIDNPQPGSSRTQNYNISHKNFSQVILATALVKIKSPYSKQSTICRALIDPGSQSTIITERIVQLLQLKKEKTCVQVFGAGMNSLGNLTAKTAFILTNLQENILLHGNAFVMKEVTQFLPERSFQQRNWPHIQNLKLADPNYNKSDKIDILIGADLYRELILQNVRIGPTGSPVAQETIFGWILTGEIESRNTQNIAVFHTQVNTEMDLRKFWELEEMIEKKHFTEEEEECEKHFQKTFKRLSDGRYEVKLPIKKSSELGYSRKFAVARLLSCERQFKKNPDFKTEYCNCLNEYVTLGHMERTVSTENPKVSNYLPHHAVIKESSSTTKTRIVFDASRATTSGLSLNDVMLKGPVIQDDLTTHIIKWRKYKVALTADLEKMYRQIRINKEDAEMQRIVWRDSEDKPIRDFKLTTVTFGTKSAPFQATRVLKQLALDEGAQYPAAAAKTLEDFYVDDLLSGADSEEEAIQLQSQFTNLMQSAHFSLRKWASNRERVLQHIAPEYRNINLPLHISDEIMRTLGIQWNPNLDIFTYKIQLEDEKERSWTKRAVLSEIARLFDPVGWLAPVIVKAKILIQALWLLNLDWNDEIAEKSKELVKEWETYRMKLPQISNIKINRWIGVTKEVCRIELHGFSDASKMAYAAAVYLCIETTAGEREINLIMAKTKVSPIKIVSLPKLELCGASLLAKLMKYVKLALKLNETITEYAWTDSKIVLAWLQEHPVRWTTFVANRVSLIQETLNKISWRHVASADNPVDCATRGLSPNELADHSLWWKGPSWLKMRQENWPNKENVEHTDLEKKKIVLVNRVKSNYIIDTLEEKYSTFHRIIRVFSYVIRFTTNTKKATQRNKFLYLTALEIETPKSILFKLIQEQHFTAEIQSIQRGESISSTSKLISLHPFIDGNGLLRVGGRLQKAELEYDRKYPIILPDKSYTVSLFIKNIHLDSCHGGVQLMRNILSVKYWLTNARNTIRHSNLKCISCFRQRAEVQTQLMGNLPEERVKINRPFTHTGLDYCGPFNLRTYKGRSSKNYKAYIAVFICMGVKAMHLELVTDLSANGFIGAYRRFASRRGRCSTISCDNGTNFVGASRQLRTEERQMMAELKTEIAKVFENEGVHFKFIPPAGPSWGGLWEAGVKSTKTHLKRVLGNVTLTYEEFTTVLNQIEACLNSRPLYPLSSDPDDVNALTPGHFLIGEALVTPPEPCLLEVNTNRLDRWQFLQKLLQSYWKIWSSEYLSRLQQRPKWVIKKENVKEGQLVLLKDER